MRGFLVRLAVLRQLPIVVLASLSIAVAAGGFKFVQITTQKFLEDDARLEAQNWADYLSANIPDLPQIARGETPSTEAVIFLEQARRVGRVYEFNVYSANGRLQLASRNLAATQSFDMSIDQTEPRLAGYLHRGQPHIYTSASEVNGETAYSAAALIPIAEDGDTVGWYEIQIDQTDRWQLFYTSAARIAIATGLLLIIAPALGFWYRTRQKVQVERRLEHLVQFDQLTGLANRSAFLKRVDSILSSDLPEDNQAAFVEMGVTSHAAVAEVLGHQAGEHMLCVIADRLRNSAGPNVEIGRFGAEIFTLFLPSAKDPMDAMTYVRDLADKISQPVEWRGQRLTVDIASGIVMAPGDGRDAATLSGKASLARKTAADPSSPGYGFYDTEIAQAAQRRTQVTEAVMDACEKGYFRLDYQPFYEFSDGRIAGFEALIRIDHPKLGTISPGEFIPAAEHSGLIGQIGAWCLEEACRVAAAWPPHLVVSVNLSPAQFESGALITDIRSALDKARLPAYRLEVEITESLLLRDADLIMEQLRILKDIGVNIVLDDFGTGYSSLGYLWKFPFSKIKIDRSFVSALDTSASARGILHSIIGLGHGLGVTVTAEGIETDEHARTLRELECDYAQGYLLSRPVRVADIAPLILKNFSDGLKPEGTAAPAAVVLKAVEVSR